jgi:hypothetical protein
MFLAADADCSGGIDPNELYVMLTKLDPKYAKITEQQVK